MTMSSYQEFKQDLEKRIRYAQIGFLISQAVIVVVIAVLALIFVD